MKQSDNAKIVAWTLAIQNLQDKIQNLQRKAKELDNKRIELLEEDKDQDIESIDISNVNLKDFSGEIKVE